MSDDDDKVKRLPVRFKKPVVEEGRTLQVVHYEHDKCRHDLKVTYLIREGETEVECSGCGTKLDPMWVLRKLAAHDSQYYRARERYQEEMKRLNERSRTKCEHCGHMTRISRR
jgi:predicted nucleic acid-binding Zn ribbon protein